MDATLPFFKRMSLAWGVLFDAKLAARLVDSEVAALPAPPTVPPSVAVTAPAEVSLSPALQLLGLLQREGRLVDFLQQEVKDFSDADIGAVARVVHEGCRKALRAHARIEPVRSEAEGAPITLAEDFDRATVKLTGAVSGHPPFRGVLRHRGWRIAELSLPTLVGNVDPSVVAPAEVEL